MTTDRKPRSRQLWTLVLTAIAAAGCAEGDSMDAPEGSEGMSDAETPAVVAEAPRVEAGALMTFHVAETISTATHEVGDRFTASLQSDVAASDGSVGLPVGTPSRWIVTESTRSGADGQALLAFRLESVQRNGDWVPVPTTVTETELQTDARDSNTETAAKVAVGAAAGAIIGQIIGRDTESTLTGAGVGAAVGAVVALTTRDGNAELPAGSTVTVRLDEELVIDR